MEANKTLKILSSDGSKEYTVEHFETFSTCSCPGYKYRQDCKHIRMNKGYSLSEMVKKVNKQ